MFFHGSISHGIPLPIFEPQPSVGRLDAGGWGIGAWARWSGPTSARARARALWSLAWPESGGLPKTDRFLLGQPLVEGGSLGFFLGKRWVKLG